MKRLKFLLGNDYAISLTLPVFSRSEKTTSIVKFTFFLGIVLLFLFFAFLPLSGQLGVLPNTESNYFNFLVAFIVVSYIGYFIVLSLNGSKRIVDPSNFLSILIFALLSTAAAVLVIPASITNTFGITSLRGISGAFIMSAIGLYYLINVYIQDRTLLKRAIYTITFGFLIYFVFLLATSYGENTMIANNIVNIAPLFILLSALLLYSRMPKFIPIILLFASGIVTLISFANYKGVMMNLYNVIISLSITGLIFSIYFAVVNRSYIRNRIKELKMKKNRAFKTRLRLVVPLIVLLLPFVIFLTGFIFQILTKQQFLLAFNNLGEVKVGFDNLFNNTSLSSGGTRVLVGLGGRVLNSDFSLVSNIISSQGLVGLTAYVFLAVSSLIFGFRLLKKMLFSTQDYKIALTLMFILVYGMVISFFAYPGILTIILWWISLSLITVLSKVFASKRNEVILEDLGFVKSKRLTKGRFNFQYVFALLVVIFGAAAIGVLSRITY